MPTNLLKAIINIIDSESLTASSAGLKLKSNIRINNMGEALEEYMKMAFTKTFGQKEKDRLKQYEKSFSYIGNQNNPPDLIIKDSDAIEIKKIESKPNQIALNSSYPKHKLTFTDEQITNSCKNSELKRKQVKDILYAIGYVEKKEEKIINLWFV